MKAARRLRAGDPRAVRRRARVHALLRRGDRGAGPGLDEPGRRDGRAHGGRQAAARVRHRRAEGPLPAADGDRRDPGHDGADRAGRRLRPAGHAHHRPPRRRRRTSSTAPRRGSPTPAARSSSRCCARPTPARRPAAQAASASCWSSTARASPSRGTCPSSATRAWRAASSSFDDYRAPADALLGGVEGRGLRPDDDGPGDRPDPGGGPGARRRAGRASRTRCATPRSARAFGQPIWKHQSIGN